MLGKREQRQLVAALRAAGSHCQEKDWTVFAEWFREALSQASIGLEPDNLEKIRPLAKAILGYDPLERDTLPKGEKRPGLARSEAGESPSLQDLRRRIYIKAKAEKAKRFWGLYVHVSKMETLREAYRLAKKNNGAPGINRRLIALPEGATPFAQKTRRWMQQLTLPPGQRFMLDNALILLAQIEERVAAVDAELLAHATITENAKLLMTIPGIDVTVAIALLAAIGDVERFPTAPKLAAYFGLVPKVRQSAGRSYHGGITKAGNCTARSLAIEAAQALARSGSPLTATYYRVRHKRGHNVAVTALARKLILVVWHMLKNRQPYRYAPVDRTRVKLRRVTPNRTRACPAPKTLESIYTEAGLPTLTPPSPGERRAAASNRRTKTRLAKRTPTK